MIWAAGASWPLPDTASLSDAVIGHDKFPSPAACLAVAGALAVGSALVAGLPKQHDRLQRIGATGVVGVLATRGIFGLAGDAPRFAGIFVTKFSPMGPPRVRTAVPDARGAGSTSGAAASNTSADLVGSEFRYGR